MPVPSAVVGLLSPCDGTTMLQQVLQHNQAWKNVPLFAPDPPYTSDERAINYFANELRTMVSFLEENTGRRWTCDRLREVCEESNRTYSLWQEYNELRRAVPCPHGWEIGGAQAFAVSQCFVAGDPRCTDWFRQLRRVRRDQGERGPRGANRSPRRRSACSGSTSCRTAGSSNSCPGSSRSWGAVLVMDMFSNFPYTMIDTSSEETMFHDLAKRNLMDVPMIRQARGTAENFSSDITRMVKDYKIDCVIWPGHMGHKDGAATAGIMRETCRDLGVPFLHIGLDLFDKRYTTRRRSEGQGIRVLPGMGLGIERSASSASSSSAASALVQAHDCLRRSHPTGHRIRGDDAPARSAGAAIRLAPRRRSIFAPDCRSRSAPAPTRGVILRSDTLRRTGQPGCRFVRVRCCGRRIPPLLEDGRVTLVGPGHSGIAGGSLPFGQVVFVGGNGPEPATTMPAIGQAQFVADQIEGYMVRSCGAQHLERGSASRSARARLLFRHAWPAR